MTKTMKDLSRKGQDMVSMQELFSEAKKGHGGQLQDVNRLDCLNFLQELDELFQRLAATLQISSYVKSEFHRLDAT